MFDNFGLAIKAYFKAIGFIFSNNLWWFFIFPVILNIGVFVGNIYTVGYFAKELQAFIQANASFDETVWWGAVLAWMMVNLSFMIGLVLRVVLFVVFSVIGGYLVLMLLSPVLAYLSEKTEKIITGANYETDMGQMLMDVLRGILIALRNLLYELAWMLIVFFVGLLLQALPVIGQIVGLLSTVFMFFISSYFFGFSFIDYMSERRRMNINQSVQFVRRNKGLAMGNGAMYSLFLLIPYCGMFLASFVAIVSVVAAVLSVIDVEKKAERFNNSN